MGRTPWATHLWPGLPLICKKGGWLALGCALAFAALVNFAVVASFVWTEVLPSLVRKAAWMAIAGVWVGSVLVDRWRERGLDGSGDVARPDAPFREAVEQYLQGNWFETECVLADLLRRNPRDVEAGLMLATLYRHTGRLEEAVERLAHLERLDEAAKWALEIDRERRWLAEVRKTPSDEPVGVSQGD